jgi:antitoxin HicB
VIARQLMNEMKKKKITKQRMAALVRTSRAQVDRPLDPDMGVRRSRACSGRREW